MSQLALRPHIRADVSARGLLLELAASEVLLIATAPDYTAPDYTALVRHCS